MRFYFYLAVRLLIDQGCCSWAFDSSGLGSQVFGLTIFLHRVFGYLTYSYWFMLYTSNAIQINYHQ